MKDGNIRVRQVETGDGDPEFVIDYDARPWHHEANRLMREREIVVINGAVWTAKTTFGTLKVLENIQRPDPSGRGEPIWWVAGLLFQMEAFWTKLESVAAQIGIRTRTFPWRQAEYPGGSKLHCVTAKELDNLAAHHPWLIIGDEVAKWSEQAWNLVRVRMATARALLMSSPRPNFWKKLVEASRRGKDKRYGGLTVTTRQAGLVTPAQIEAARRDLPEEFFEQEFEAKIISASGSVFRNIEARLLQPMKDPNDGEVYVATYDPAKHQDFGVVAIWRGFDQVALYRWQRTAYLWQAEEVSLICRTWNGATCIMDANGPGEAVFELIEREGARGRNLAREIARRIAAGETGKLPGIDPKLARGFAVVPVRWNNQEKSDLVMAAQIRFERGELGLLDPRRHPDYATSMEEHRAFARHRSGSGLTYTYEAPPGMHDDCVSTTLLRLVGAAVPRITVSGGDRRNDGERGESRGEAQGIPRISVRG